MCAGLLKYYNPKARGKLFENQKKTLIRPSWDPETIHFPSGLTCMQLIGSLCSLKVPTELLVLKSQSLIEASQEPLSNKCLQSGRGKHAIVFTEVVWPLREEDTTQNKGYIFEIIYAFAAEYPRH